MHAQIFVERGLIDQLVLGAEHGFRSVGFVLHGFHDARAGEAGQREHFLHMRRQPVAVFDRDFAVDGEIDFIDRRTCGLDYPAFRPGASASARPQSDDRLHDFPTFPPPALRQRSTRHGHARLAAGAGPCVHRPDRLRRQRHRRPPQHADAGCGHHRHGAVVAADDGADRHADLAHRLGIAVERRRAPRGDRPAVPAGAVAGAGRWAC